MKIFGKFLLVLFILDRLVPGQTVRLEPDLAVVEAEYHDAEDLWLRNDPNLESELYSADRQQILKRIHQSATLRADVMKKKEAYLGLMVNRITELQKRIGPASSAAVPTETIKSSLKEEQTRILSEQDRLEALIRDMPQGDEYTLVRRAMEAQRVELLNLQNNIAQRMRGLDALNTAQTEEQTQSQNANLAQKLAEVKEIWEGERKRASDGGRKWGRYYADLEKSLDQHPDGKPAKTNGSPTPRSKTPPAKANQPDTRDASSGAKEQFAGRWSYHTAQGAWSGWAEPQMAVLELHPVEDHLEGTYSARILKSRDVRDINLIVRGKIEGKGRVGLEWTSEQPMAKGKMRLQLSGDRRLLAERLTSNDSYIPTGMEILLPQ